MYWILDHCTSSKAVDDLWIRKGLEEECSWQGAMFSHWGWGGSTGSCVGADQNIVMVQLGGEIIPECGLNLINQEKFQEGKIKNAVCHKRWEETKNRGTPYLFRYFCVSSRILWESKWLVAIFLAWDTMAFIFSASSRVSFSSCLCCLSRSRLERKSWPVSDSWRTFSIFSIFFLASCQEKITAHSYCPFNNIFFHSLPPTTTSWTQFLNPIVLSW